MGLGDSLQPAYPNNTHKQDWALYTFVGGRGGGGGVATTTTRYTYWIDFDPFDIQNLKMLSENLSFQIYGDAFFDYTLTPHYIVDQSNDITDELIQANLPTKAGQSISVGTATINYPPFGYIDSLGVSLNPGVPPTSSATEVPVITGIAATDKANAQLTTGTTYYYCVTAIKGGVESIASNVVSYTPTIKLPSPAITFTNISGTNPATDYYKVYRNTVPTFTSGNLWLDYGNTGQPPYFVNTTFTSQPTNNAFRNDQGNYTLKGYHNFGFGFGGTNMVAQGFVPQQSMLTGFFLGAIFHSNTTDHTTFYPLNFELWDANKTFLAHLGTLQPDFNLSKGAFGLTTDSSATAICNNLSYNIGDDGVTRWTSLTQPTLKLNTPISLTVGATYYIVLRLATLSTTNYYFLGNNTDATSTRDALYYYPFANAFSANDGSSTWSTIVDSNSKPITFPFLTQGNVGRYAITFWWGDIGAANAFYPSSSYPLGNEYVFLHVDYNQRI